MFHLNYLLPAKCLQLNLVPGTEISAPFRLYILTGNITTCYGCKEQFVISGPPYDLIVQHEEDRQFFNPKTGALMFKRSNMSTLHACSLPGMQSHVLAFI